MPRVVIVAGNPNAGSRLTGVLEAARQELEKLGVLAEWIRIADFPPEDLIGAKFDSPAVIAANASLEQADAVIVGSPVYKAAYSGVLKTYLDLLPQKALEKKPVLPVFIGGSIAHLLAIDYALKPVLSVLGARCQLGGVYAVDSQVTRAAGGFELEQELRKRIRDAAAELAEIVHGQ